MPPRKADAASADTVAPQPIYTQPTDLPTFLSDIEPWLYEQDTNYRMVIETRTCMYRTYTCVTSATHARLIITDTFPTDHNVNNPAPTSYPLDTRKDNRTDERSEGSLL